MKSQWLLFSLMAFGFSLSHLFVDFQIGLFGQSSPTVSVPQAALVAAFGLLYTVWAHSLGEARRGSASGMTASLVFAAGWALVINGVGALASAPPPSEGFPYQDITHFGSLLFGALASRSLWAVMKESVSPAWRAATLPGVLIVIATILEALTALT